MVELAFKSFGVILILVVFAFALYLVFVPLLATMIGGLQIMELFSSRNVEAGLRRKQLQIAYDSPRRVQDRTRISYVPPAIPRMVHYMW
jgi:hypothetical protein